MCEDKQVWPTQGLDVIAHSNDTTAISLASQGWRLNLGQVKEKISALIQLYLCITSPKCAHVRML
jgi:hypothetical protein